MLAVLCLGLARPSLHAASRLRSAAAPRAPPLLACAPPVAPELAFELREASGFGEDWAASQLLHECFGGSP